jgi:hypothetical protein
MVTFEPDLLQPAEISIEKKTAASNNLPAPVLNILNNWFPVLRRD